MERGTLSPKTKVLGFGTRQKRLNQLSDRVFANTSQKSLPWRNCNHGDGFMFFKRDGLCSLLLCIRFVAKKFCQRVLFSLEVTWCHIDWTQACCQQTKRSNYNFSPAVKVCAFHLSVCLMPAEYLMAIYLILNSLIMLNAYTQDGMRCYREQLTISFLSKNTPRLQLRLHTTCICILWWRL